MTIISEVHGKRDRLPNRRRNVGRSYHLDRRRGFGLAWIACLPRAAAILLIHERTKFPDRVKDAMYLVRLAA
jgi:hypothetical protein